jgi:Tol biopolymer transport system component
VVSPWCSFVLVALAAGRVDADVTKLVSVSSSGAQAQGDSYAPALSADGRYVAFYSNASNLVPGDIHASADVLVRDRETGVTERAGPDDAGLERLSIGPFRIPAISADGRCVAFTSGNTDVVLGDTNDVTDVFVRDRQIGLTQRVSVSSAGEQANGDSGLAPALSADGRFVAFVSEATNLVPGDTNGILDVFVHDRQTRVTERVNVDTAGMQANGSGLTLAISADGRVVAFESSATNLVPGDTNGVSDVFVHDRQTGVTERVSVDSGGAQANDTSDEPAISADGRFVAFVSVATNLVSGDTNGVGDVFVHDRQTGVTERVSVDSAGAQANDIPVAYFPAISADGRFIAFTSAAKNLVRGDTGTFQNVFVHDRQTGITERVSVNSLGVQADADSFQPALSADGRVVAFESPAHNLVGGDANGFADVFVRAPCSGAECVLGDTSANRACAGQPLPARVTKKLDRAVAWSEQASSGAPRRADRLLKRARKALTMEAAAATRAAKGRRPRISSDCASALRDAAARFAMGLNR